LTEVIGPQTPCLLDLGAPCTVFWKPMFAIFLQTSLHFFQAAATQELRPRDLCVECVAHLRS
jgi:hypothetical protein